MRGIVGWLLCTTCLHAAEPATPAAWKELKYRSIGPAAGGRVSAVAGVPGDFRTYYLAAASSGVWKSTDGGTSFKPIFDDQPTSSIGAIAVAPSDANVVYVGSGEANIRGNVSAGNGIYRSLDAGKTWVHVWKQIGQIGKIVVHPTDSKIAYAAVLGNAFAPNPERGVYRTTDGGTSWKRVLTVDADVGASDVSIDVSNPRTLFAGTWRTRRKPWEMTSGGPGCALWVSHDAGDSWKKLSEGLPKGTIGKVSVAVAPSDSRRVYAMIEAEKGGLFRSDDGGETWTLASDDAMIRRRPWYFNTLTVDPKNPDVVYAPQVQLMRSIDAGKTFKILKGPHHGDHHDLWIDPADPRRMIAAHDGGVDITLTTGESWHAPPLPIAQFYHVSCDNRTPYHVMGCMQDLGSASGPSRSLTGSGIPLGEWSNIGGGEAGHAVPEVHNPNIVYAGEYSGILTRFDRAAGQARPVMIYPFDPSGYGAEALDYRFQWTSPVLASRHDPKVVYHASNVLFRTRDGGQRWEKASPDLSRNDKRKQQWSGGPITGDNTGVEVYGTIFALAESAKDAKLLWAGSDDGLVHVSRNAGVTWENVTAHIPDLPDWGTVVCIEPSPFDAGTAYVVVEAHRLNDPTPYLWKTTDFGQTWKRLTIPDAETYLHVVRCDPAKKGRLYVGTERGILTSGDDGATWQGLRLNLPTVAVHDLVVKDADLVVATMGRSLWILDDLTAIREKATLFPTQPAIRWRSMGGISKHQARASGDNAPTGAIVQFQFATKPKTATVTILDATGKKIITAEGGAEDAEEPDEEAEELKLKPPTFKLRSGVTRWVWDLRHPGATPIAGARVDAGDPTVGPLVRPGKYTVELVVDGKTHRTPLEVRLDPRVTEPRGLSRIEQPAEMLTIAPRSADGKNDVDAPWLKRSGVAERLQEEAAATEQLSLQLRDRLGTLSSLVERLRSAKLQTQRVRSLVRKEATAKDWLTAADALVEKIDALEAKLHNPKARVTYDILAQPGGAQLYSQLAYLADIVQTGDGPPTQGMLERFAALDKEWGILESAGTVLLRDDVAGLNVLAGKHGYPNVWLRKPE